MLAAAASLSNHIVQAPPAFLAYAAGTIVPILVAILAKSTASRPLKVILNSILVAVGASLVVSIKMNGAIDLYGWGSAIAEAAIASWASYNGFWKPLGVAPAIHKATAKFGIG